MLTITMEPLAQAMRPRHRMSVKQSMNKYSGVAIVPERNPAQYPKLNLLMTFLLFLGAVTLMLIMMFKSKCTGQLSEQEGPIYLVTVFQLHPPGVAGADCDCLEATQEAGGMQGNLLGYSIEVKNKLHPMSSRKYLKPKSVMI